jgi:DNA-binding PadR family transcriptional regulator
MKKKPASEFALLGALMSRPRHGYEILRFLETGLGPTWHVGTSQLYALLKKLEERDLLTSSLRVQATRPSKRIFSLTPQGKTAFLDWLQSPTTHVRDLRIEFLAKLFFFERLSIQGGEKLIDAQTLLLERIRADITSRHKNEEESYTRLVFGFRLATIDAWLEWLQREARTFLEEIK